MVNIIMPIATLLVGLYTGFYFGYLKRENKPPAMPIISEIRQLKQYIENRLEEAEIKPKQENEPKSWFDQ
jgi:hypothetical protein